jgi:hypothetical protein
MLHRTESFLQICNVGARLWFAYCGLRLSQADPPQALTRHHNYVEVCATASTCMSPQACPHACLPTEWGCLSHGPSRHTTATIAVYQSCERYHSAAEWGGGAAPSPICCPRRTSRLHWIWSLRHQPSRHPTGTILATQQCTTRSRILHLAAPFCRSVTRLTLQFNWVCCLGH